MRFAEANNGSAAIRLIVQREMKNGDTISHRSTEDNKMRHVDFSPLYRSTVGFDRLFNLLDSMGQPEQSAPAYPPYNIERTGENAYRISMAVAGFGEQDLKIEAKENTLLVKGSQSKDEEEGDMLFRGIAARNFERRFQLADHVEVRNAQLENGLLHIDLVREIPEAMKARKIEISGQASRQIEGKSRKKV
jgi:molecular chaperone IbpA